MVETDSFGSLSITARRVRHRRPGLRAQPQGGRDRQGGGPRVHHARHAPLGGRLDRPRHQVPVPRPDPLRRAARRLRGAGPGPARRRRRPAHHRDRVRPPPGQGRHHRLPAGHGRRRPPGARSRSRSPSSSPGACSPGTEIGAALTALDAMRPDVIGLNCATGPAEMHEHLRHLSQHCRVPISCLPNAGLPSVVDGKMHYDLTPDQLAEHHARLRHRARRQRRSAAAAAPRPSTSRPSSTGARTSTPAPRNPVHEPAAASIYTPVPFQQDTSFLVVGERTNANGSKKFREAMLAADWDTCVAMAQRPGEGGRPRPRRVRRLHRRGRRRATWTRSPSASPPRPACPSCSTPPSRRSSRPACSGSAARPSSTRSTWRTATPPAPASTASSAWPGSTAPPSSARCIDEEGQARTAEWKLRAAKAIHDLAVDRYGLEPADLIFDALALPLSTGMEESRRDGIETIEGIRRIKAELPGVSTILGLSNVSLRPHAGRPPRPQLGVPARVRARPGSTRPSSTRPGSCR